MKPMILPVLFAGIFTASISQAAIENASFSCGPVHAFGRTGAIAGAPSYSLDCSRNNPVPETVRCTLNVDGESRKLHMVIASGSSASLMNTGTDSYVLVNVNFANGSALIGLPGDIQGLQTECTRNE